jgi:CTP:molybdopterin cytidylyltransferase MocA
MGYPKALLSRQGVPVALSLCQAMFAAGLERVHCTLPPEEVLLPQYADRVHALGRLLQSHGVSLLRNEHWFRGLIGSVWAALQTAGGMDALLMTPVDAPQPSPILLLELQRLGASHPGAGVSPRGSQGSGHPVLLPRLLFRDIQAFHGEGGVREVLKAHPSVALPWPDAVCANINTEEDAQAFTPPFECWTA